jgi:hypothetical protein
MMTSFAFILGLLPSVIATGPGAAGRREIGTPVFYGMLASAVMGVKGGCRRQADGAAGLPSAPEMPCAPRLLRLVPLPDSCTAAKRVTLVGMGKDGLLGQPRFPKALDEQLRV